MTDPDAHLLIVDDDERIRGLLQKYLIRHGFLVSSARDAAHADAILRGLEFDLIVLDVMMPGEDGVSFCKRLRESHDVPVLLLTAKNEIEDRLAGPSGRERMTTSQSPSSRRSFYSASIRYSGGCRPLNRPNSPRSSCRLAN